MKTSTEIRLENARALIDEAGGRPQMAKRLGMSESQLGQIIGPNPKRNIGPAMARRIERAFSLERGWLDLEQKTNGNGSSAPGTLRAMQIQEALRILNHLSDADVTRALVWLQTFEHDPNNIPKI